MLGNWARLYSVRTPCIDARFHLSTGLLVLLYKLAQYVALVRRELPGSEQGLGRDVDAASGVPAQYRLLLNEPAGEAGHGRLHSSTMADAVALRLQV